MKVLLVITFSLIVHFSFSQVFETAEFEYSRVEEYGKDSELLDKRKEPISITLLFNSEDNTFHLRIKVWDETRSTIIKSNDLSVVKVKPSVYLKEVEPNAFVYSTKEPFGDKGSLTFIFAPIQNSLTMSFDNVEGRATYYRW